MKIEPLKIKNNLEIIYSKSDETNLFFFPENFNEVNSELKFIYSESTIDIKKIFKRNNQNIEYLNQEKPLLRLRKSADWFGPILFISFSTLMQNSELINISLNIISNYLYDFFKSSLADKKIKIDVIIESKKKKEYKIIKYEGNIEGLKEIEKIIKQLKK